MLRELGQHYGEAGFALEPARDPSGLTTAIAAYLAGELGAIDSLAVENSRDAFSAPGMGRVADGPCGTTTSYAAIAKQSVGLPLCGPWGLANGSNPIGVVVPCHRVIGSDGSLTGYGGGLSASDGF